MSTTSFLKTFLLIVFVLAMAHPVLAGAPSGNATLSIPALNLNMSVGVIPFNADRTAWDTTRLGRGIGHLTGTNWLGENSNIVIGGHYDLPNGRPGAFYRLGNVKIGDSIILSDGDVVREFRVVEVKMVDQRDVQVAYPTGSERLTLMTCAGAYDAATQSYSQRLVVVAEPVN